MGPLEVLYLAKIPILMLRDAADDIAAGAPDLRVNVWGIMKTGPIERVGNVTPIRRDIRYPYYKPPPRTPSLVARLALTPEYRNMPVALCREARIEGLAQLAGWAAARNLRFVVPVIQE